jgi:glycine cleavage system H protein
MAVIEKFLGLRVTIPENLHYLPQLGLWARTEKEWIVFGFSEPALALSGGLNSVDWLVEDGQMVVKGDTIVFALTEKPIYLDAPAKGVIEFNLRLKNAPVLAKEDPYGDGWVFKMFIGDCAE